MTHNGTTTGLRLLRVPEAAVVLGVSAARTYELIRVGILPSVRLGRQVRIDLAALEEFVRAGGRGLPLGSE